MSLQALNAALSGLRVAQQQLNTISANVANVGTPGYTRKILPQGSQVVQGTGEIIGVLPGTVIRSVDLNLEKDLWTQISATSSADIRVAYLGVVEKFHGPPDSELSLAAQISKLKDSFSALAEEPENGFALQATLDQAGTVTRKFNDYSDMIIELRNETQDDIGVSVARINGLLQQIADYNAQVKNAGNSRRSTAGVADQRDLAIKQLSEEMDISVYQRGDGVLVIQSPAGVQLADERADELYFNGNILGPNSYYPDSASGVFLGGNPNETNTAVDITTGAIGGKLGALLELRDETLPSYQAQIDELAHKLALRMDAQGLRLFTDTTGQIPADTPPDPTAGPPPVAVAYVGFAGRIQVNTDIVNDITLLQSGTFTSDVIIPPSSSQVIRRVIEFGFGDVNYQEAAGTTDLNVVGPATDLQEWLGVYSQNNVVSGVNLSTFAEVFDADPLTNTDIVGALSAYFPNYPADAQFQITFDDRIGPGSTTITVDLAAAAAIPIGGAVTDALDQVIAEINNQLGLSGIPANLQAQATRNTNGQLVIQSRGDLSIDASSFVGAMGTTALQAIGLQEGSFATEDPYFDIQIGNNTPVRITIAPGEDQTDLVNKLEWDIALQAGVPGLHVDFDALTGQLTLRPGIDDSNGGPAYGGDMRIIGGPFETSGAPVNPALAALPDTVSLIAALFGSYTVAGPNVTEVSAVVDVAYRSEVSAGSGTFVPFRTQYLGGGANINTNILTSINVVDFAQKAVNAQTQDLITAQNSSADESTLRDILERQLLDESGVNIDEEMSQLIVVQTAYAAAARAVTAADEMFQELLNAI